MLRYGWHQVIKALMLCLELARCIVLEALHVDELLEFEQFYSSFETP
jgi:hypothetical protein